MPFQIECISDAITFFFSLHSSIYGNTIFEYTQRIVVLEYIRIFFVFFGSFKSGKRRAPLKNTFTSRENTYSGQNISNINFISFKEIAADLCHSIGVGKTQAIRRLSGRFSHRFSCSAIIFRRRRRRRCRSKLIFKWFNQCNGSSFKSKTILSLQRQISCPYLSFFLAYTHMSV